MYYPKSQIKTGLYTNGDEYANSRDIPYVGTYWKTSSGEVFSGLGPQDKSSFKLFEIVSKKSLSTDYNIELNITDLTPETLSYFSAKKIDIKNPPKFKTPQYSLNIPNSDDYQNGTYLRYFAKQSNRNVYIEINKSTFNDLDSGNPEYEFNNYNIFKLKWTISGESEELVADQNYELVNYYEEKLKYPGFISYFTNYAEFYKP